MGEGWGAGMSTKSMTHEAVADALSNNQPLTGDQRAVLMGLVAVDKRWQRELDARDAELAALRALSPLCEKHSTPGGHRALCLVCAGQKLESALGRISYACEEPNEYECSSYAVHCDEDAVVEQVKALRAECERLRASERSAWNAAVVRDEECERLRKDAERAVGKTAARCREMAMWPQGIDDEQAYYGRMFAEFITKEFGAAIDAAMTGEPR